RENAYPTIFCMPTTSAALKMMRTSQKTLSRIEESRGRLETFLFSKESDTWLAILRIGLGLQVGFYALSLKSDWNYLLGGGNGGLNGRALSEGLLSAQTSLIPRLGWVLSLAKQIGVSESQTLSITWWILLCG